MNSSLPVTSTLPRLLYIYKRKETEGFIVLHNASCTQPLLVITDTNIQPGNVTNTCLGSLKCRLSDWIVLKFVLYSLRYFVVNILPYSELCQTLSDGCYRLSRTPCLNWHLPDMLMPRYLTVIKNSWTIATYATLGLTSMLADVSLAHASQIHFRTKAVI